MSSEAQVSENALPDVPEVVCPDEPTASDATTYSRLLPNSSSSSGATEKSLAAYADRTLGTLAATDVSLDITFLNTPNQRRFS